MYGLVFGGDGVTVAERILLADDADPSAFGAVAAPNDEVGPGWTHVDGKCTAPIAAPVVLTAAEEKAAATAAISALVQATARARNYDSAESCASYVSSTNPPWAAEAHAFVAWRDAVWSSAYATLAAVESGHEPAPTVEALLAGLPAIDWPAA